MVNNLFCLMKTKKERLVKLMFDCMLLLMMNMIPY